MQSCQEHLVPYNSGAARIFVWGGFRGAQTNGSQKSGKRRRQCAAGEKFSGATP